MTNKYVLINILGKIGLSLLLIGLINLYNILKYGIIISIPSNFIKNDNFNIPSLKLDITNIKIIIIISLFIFFIFSNKYNSLFSNFNNSELSNNLVTYKKKESLEYQLLIGLSLLGLIWIMISRDIISLYLGLELYSFSYYILILVKESLVIRRISIIYLILSSLASSLLLYSFYLIYNLYGSLNLDIISTFKYNLTLLPKESINILYLITIGLIFKLGLIPFSFWLIRLYADLDKKILWYQLTIPKLVFFLLFLNFLIFLPFSINTFISNFSNYSLNFIYLLFIIGILSIIVGSIGGLFQNKDNILLSYSSILNLGFIFLSLSLILYNSPFGALSSDSSYIYTLDLILPKLLFNKIWINLQYFFIYFINLLGLFAAIFLYHKSSLVFNYNNFYKFPFFFLSFLFLIFSFIGLPPFSGFFAKYYLIFTLITNNNILTILSISSLILFTIISSFLYFKFLFSSTTLNTLNLNLISKSYSNEKEFFSKYGKSSFGSLILSFTSLFSFFYSLFIPLFIPFFYIF